MLAFDPIHPGNSAMPIGINHIRNVFPKFPTDHLLGNLNLLIRLAVVYCEAQTDKVGQNSCGALLRPNRRRVGGGRERPWKGETRNNNQYFVL
jgi:hypothetical protein